jgi:hypothetical protein
MAFAAEPTRDWSFPMNATMIPTLIGTAILFLGIVGMSLCAVSVLWKADAEALNRAAEDEARREVEEARRAVENGRNP